MSGVLWFDASNHQWQDAQTWLAELRAAWSRGERGVVLNTYGPHALAMLEAAHLVGFRLRIYVYLNFPGGQFWTGVSAHDQVTNAIDKMGATGLPIERIGLDCEDEGNTLDPPATVAFIQEAADACTGRLFSEIYTAPAWWRQFTADSHAFADWPLWLAAPSGSVPDSLALTDPFGGWVRAAEIQYDFHGHIDDGGTEFDLDVEATDSTEAATASDAPAPIVLPRNAEFVVPEEVTVEARPLSPDETLTVNEQVYAEFTDVSIDQRGGGMYELSGALPAVNGQAIPVPAGGHAYLTVVPAPKG